jgi:2-amino-4-hydroxy-6-hydroxymethyldihydropteridine diphosphokinase
MPRSLIALGANLGDREKTLARAIERLAATAGIAVVAHSPWLETAPVGGPGEQPAFLNGAAILETTLDAQSLARRLHEIETELGRRRTVRWDARALDLDLLLYDDLAIDSPQLVVPHPRMAVRRFVLEPAAMIAGDWVHPTVGWTIERLWRHLLEAPAYLAIAGVPGSGKTLLAEQLTKHRAARLIADPPAADLAAGASVAPGNSSGPAARREIEFLVRRQKLLDRQTWPESDLWAVSDFWFDQSLAWSAVYLDQADQTAVREAWCSAASAVVPPKLLIVLASGERAAAREGRSDESPDDAERRRLNEELDRLSRRPGIGPVLRLRADDWETTTREAAAALIAMR